MRQATASSTKAKVGGAFWEVSLDPQEEGRSVDLKLWNSIPDPPHSIALWPKASASGGKMYQGGVCALTGHQEGCGRPITPPCWPSGWSGLTLQRNRPARTPELYQSGSWLGWAGDLRTMKWNFHFRAYSFFMRRPRKLSVARGDLTKLTEMLLHILGILWGGYLARWRPLHPGTLAGLTDLRFVYFFIYI